MLCVSCRSGVRGVGEMNAAGILRLLVALARCLEIDVRVLAKFYRDREGCQEFLDRVVELAQKGTDTVK